MPRVPATAATRGFASHPTGTHRSFAATRHLARWATQAAIVLLAASAAVLCWRRLAGALQTPLSIASLLLLGLLLGLAATLMLASPIPWLRWQQPAGRRHVRSAVPTSVSLLLIAWALSVPGSSGFGLVLLWGMLAGGLAAGFVTAGYGTHDRTIGQPPPHHRSQPQPVAALASDIVEAPPASAETDRWGADGASDEARLLQRLERVRREDGSEVLSGRVRVEMATGQRSGSVHVPFCPPFSRTPRVTVRQLNGPPSRLKTAQNRPFGARIDVKLSQGLAEPSELLLEFTAQARKPNG